MMYYTKIEEIAEMTSTLQAIACNDEHPWQERAEYILGEVEETRELMAALCLGKEDPTEVILEGIEEVGYLLADFIKEMMHG